MVSLSTTICSMEKCDERPRSTRFLEAYNRLDDLMRKRMNARPGVNYSQLLQEMVKRGDVLQSALYELEAFARLRNAIVHNPLASDSRPIAEPHPDVVRKYENLVLSVLKPPPAMTVAVPADRTFTADWSDGVLRVVEMMRKNVYTHVPILQNERIVGVFSESTLFAALAANRRIAIDDATTLHELRAFVPSSGDASEVFEFLSATASIAEVALRFQTNFKERRRLGALFLTESGDQSGRLSGLITAWDVANLFGE